LDSLTDVTMILSNAAFVFANQSTLARLAAAAALEGWEEPQNKFDRHYAQRMAIESGRLEALADTWAARAAQARAGYLLFSKSEAEDTEFLFTYGELIKTCRDAGRIIYSRAIDADVNAATSPKPGGPLQGEAMSSPVAIPKGFGQPGYNPPGKGG
jgi:hypothetical protein